MKYKKDWIQIFIAIFHVMLFISKERVDWSGGLRYLEEGVGRRDERVGTIGGWWGRAWEGGRRVLTTQRREETSIDVLIRESLGQFSVLNRQQTVSVAVWWWILIFCIGEEQEAGQTKNKINQRTECSQMFGDNKVWQDVEICLSGAEENTITMSLYVRPVWFLVEMPVTPLQSLIGDPGHEH